MKKSDDIKKSIIDMVRRLNPTKSAVCKKHGITWQTLKNWMQEDPAFADEYRQAVKDYLQDINVSARKSLSKLVKGYNYYEEKTIYGPAPEGSKDNTPIICQIVRIKKHVPPNAMAVTYALTNLDPENFE